MDLVGKGYKPPAAEPSPFVKQLYRVLQERQICWVLFVKAVLKVDTVKCLLRVYKCISHSADTEAAGPPLPPVQTTEAKPHGNIHTSNWTFTL